MTELLNSQQVIDRTGATYRQLDHWTRRGYVAVAGQRPLKRSTSRVGSGVPRLYDPGEVEVIRLMARLVDAGLDPVPAARAARNRGWLNDDVFVVVLGEPSLGDGPDDERDAEDGAVVDG